MSTLCVLGVRPDDVAHQPVAHDVPVPQIAEPDPFDPGKDPFDLEQAGILPVGQVDLRLDMRRESSRLARSICVLSPVITAREFTPRRVRNIFICMPVAFCASSRITNASLSVRPRM